MTTQVVILRAVRDFVPHLARLKNVTMAFFNGLLDPHSRRTVQYDSYALDRPGDYHASHGGGLEQRVR